MQPIAVLTILHVFLAFALIGIILIQRGKGAEAGAAFGSGGSATVFGARGAASFLTRTTAILAIVFFLNSLFLAYMYSHVTEKKSLMAEPLLEIQDMEWTEVEESEEDGKKTGDESKAGGETETPPGTSESASAGDAPSDTPEVPGAEIQPAPEAGGETPLEQPDASGAKSGDLPPIPE